MPILLFFSIHCQQKVFVFVAFQSVIQYLIDKKWYVSFAIDQFSVRTKIFPLKTSCLLLANAEYPCLTLETFLREIKVPVLYILLTRKYEEV